VTGRVDREDELHGGSRPGPIEEDRLLAELEAVDAGWRRNKAQRRTPERDVGSTKGPQVTGTRKPRNHDTITGHVPLAPLSVALLRLHSLAF
jgi:hypothetical protein